MSQDGALFRLSTMCEQAAVTKRGTDARGVLQKHRPVQISMAKSVSQILWLLWRGRDRLIYDYLQTPT